MIFFLLNKSLHVGCPSFLSNPFWYILFLSIRKNLIKLLWNEIKLSFRTYSLKNYSILFSFSFQYWTDMACVMLLYMKRKKRLINELLRVLNKLIRSRIWLRQKHGDIQNIMQKRCSLHKRAKERKKEGEREKKRDGDRERSGLRRQHKETEVMRGEKGRRRRRRQPHHFISIHASMDKWGCPMNDLVFLFIFCPFLLSFLFFSFLSSYHLVGLRILFFSLCHNGVARIIHISHPTCSFGSFFSHSLYSSLSLPLSLLHLHLHSSLVGLQT